MPSRGVREDMGSSGLLGRVRKRGTQKPPDAGLLELARTDAGQTALVLSDVDVGALLEETAARFSAQAATWTASVDVLPGAPVPPVKADAVQVALMLSNLVANALRYVAPGGHVWLSAAGEGSGLALKVADDGPGIPAEERERIFEPLAQVRDGRPMGASGLGLAIGRSILRAHGGTLRLEETPTGATFVAFLPFTIEREASGDGLAR